MNPFLNLTYEPILENMGADYYDIVSPAEFPFHRLRFRNDLLLPIIGLTPEEVRDEDFITTFGKFECPIRPSLALCYHGYQFGEYNPYLGDGRGFLYGQVRGIDGELYDFGTKGSGRTPYSRHADGRLTLKGGVREVLAGEALHRLGVNTSRCLSLIETGESLWRGDEPSPTRSSVMVRFSRSHLRFGTFERLNYLNRPDLIQKLLDHVIVNYYPKITLSDENCYALFYQELVDRTAKLCAQWMMAGFAHGVLNTDNMSITGESFDYGPYAFIPSYNLKFTPAYFDYGGRYSYGNQPSICYLNLELLQAPLEKVISCQDLNTALNQYEEKFFVYYQQFMLRKLGLETLPIFQVDRLIAKTLQLLSESQVGYHAFFYELAEGFNLGWRESADIILENTSQPELKSCPSLLQEWREIYHFILQNLPLEAMPKIAERLSYYNPRTALLRPIIESIWQPIAEDDNWQPFKDLVVTLQQGL